MKFFISFLFHILFCPYVFFHNQNWYTTDRIQKEKGQEYFSSGEPARAMPAARRLAAELGVDLASVQGSGRDGAVTEKDVRAAQPPKRLLPLGSFRLLRGFFSVFRPRLRRRNCAHGRPAQTHCRQYDGQPSGCCPKNTVFVETDVTEMVALRDSMLARNKRIPTTVFPTTTS